jgi:hypothetical protein
MNIRYEYKSTCCSTGYIETRNELQPMVYPNCVQCGQGTYELITETILEEI